jgi:UDP-galactopyranose mutase
MNMQKTIDLYSAKIVGCGLSGTVAAVCLARKGYIVDIFETRSHIGGNCYDAPLGNVKFLHQYGPHIFHTDDEEVWDFVKDYSEWTPFKLQPKGQSTHHGLISLPYSQKTIKEIGHELTQEEIVDTIFRDYSEKQWGVQFDTIPKTITNRIPKTANCEDPTWFEGQKYQCIPKDGYTAMFHKMLDHPNIRVHLNCKPDAWKEHEAALTIYTGKVDAYYDYCHGRLPYRTLEFHHLSGVPVEEHFVVNQINSHSPYTRVYDHSYFDENHVGTTTVTREYSKECGNDDIPFYPIPWGEGQAIYSAYEEMAKKEEHVIFVGRLATYKYLDMWMAIKHVLIKLKNV